MPILSATAITGRVAWLGLVRDRAASLRSAAVERVEARLDGFVGESHSGPVRPSCSRVAELHPKGTPIRNSRQVTLLSVEELAGTAAAMGVPALLPEWVGANLVLEGLPDLTLLPPSSRLPLRRRRHPRRRHGERALPVPGPRDRGRASRPRRRLPQRGEGPARPHRLGRA